MSQDATISVVDPGTRTMRHYRLMESAERIVLGDCWVEIGEGNVPEVSPVHSTWVGTMVMECPKNVYLRPVTPTKR